MFALVFGVVYLLIGIVGFAVTGFENFAKDGDKALIIFEINPLHNIVHIAVGALLIGGARAHATAKSVNLLVGATYGLVAILGIFGALEFLSINKGADADNFLHLFTAIAALYFGTAGAEAGTRAVAA